MMDCVACEGTGVSSRGRPCSPCAGTGKKAARTRRAKGDLQLEAKSDAPFFFDCETERTRPGCQLPPLTCMSVAHAGEVRLFDHQEAPAMLGAMLLSGNKLVGHNVAFDMGVLAGEEPELLPFIYDAYEEGRVSDTMIRQKLIDNAEGNLYGYYREGGRLVKIEYGLDDLTLRLLGLELPKDDEVRLGYGKLRGVPFDQWEPRFRDYAMTDAAVPEQIWQLQEKPVWVRYLVDESRQCAAAWWIQLMGAWGLRTDPVGVSAFEEELKADFERYSALLIKHGLMRSNGTRNIKAAQARMAEACRAINKKPARTKPSRKFPEGQISLSADKCEEVNDEVMQAYADVSSTKKQLSTDIPLLMRAVRLPLHPYFETLRSTGRTASKPNVQNIPVYGKMRECFVPRAGWVYASADFDGFELRTMAQVCVKWFGSSKLADALNAGRDPHLVLAAKILKISYEEAARRHAEGDDEVYRARQTGKVGDFGYPGGMGASSLVAWAKKTYHIELTEDDAVKLKSDWLEAFPEFRAFFATIGGICERPDPETGNVRITQLFSGRVRGGMSFTDACNTTFQGLAADCAKMAGFLISRACYAEPESALYGSRIVNFVHDEFIVETREEGAPEAAEELARLMVKGASVFLPDVPPKASPLLMRRWSKKAKEIRDADGRLVPWEPEQP